jgi:hypothetical protein
MTCWSPGHPLNHLPTRHLHLLLASAREEEGSPATTGMRARRNRSNIRLGKGPLCAGTAQRHRRHSFISPSPSSTMSPVGDLEAKCTEHILSLKPTPAEARAFRELDVGLLAEVCPPRIVSGPMYTDVDRRTFRGPCPSPTTSIDTCTTTTYIAHPKTRRRQLPT